MDGGRAVSIRGREVISERECTRDAEWNLLHVVLQRSSSCQEASAAALTAMHEPALTRSQVSQLQGEPHVAYLHPSAVCTTLLTEACT